MDVWGWSSPIGLGLFILMMAASIALLGGVFRLVAGVGAMMMRVKNETTTGVANARARGRGRR
jgi:hypothetical protein